MPFHAVCRHTLLSLILWLGASASVQAGHIVPDYDFGTVGPGTYSFTDTLNDTTCSGCPPSSYFDIGFSIDSGPIGSLGYHIVLTLSNEDSSTYLDYLTSQTYDTGIFSTDETRKQYDSSTDPDLSFFGSGLSGDFSGAVAGTTPSSFTLTLEVIDPAAVPAPSTWLLMLGGLGALGFWLRRNAGGDNAGLSGAAAR